MWHIDERLQVLKSSSQTQPREYITKNFIKTLKKIQPRQYKAFFFQRKKLMFNLEETELILILSNA